MKELLFIIQDARGMHARPAGFLVKEASRYQSNITISKGSKSADAKQIFKLMSLDINCHDKISIRIEGPDEEEAITRIQELLPAILG